MEDLQSKGPEIWNIFLDRNLSVSKSLVSFCFIGVDYALEKENNNMSMKIQGRIKGIRNNESALVEHFLILCEISQITEAFLKSLHLSSNKINK